MLSLLALALDPRRLAAHEPHSGSQHEHEQAASLHRALQSVRAERTRLLAYYDGDTRILQRAPIVPPEDADARLCAQLALLALGHKRRLVIGAIGSSVTAGHDGFGDAAWPRVIERWLGPTIKQLGGQLMVRNQAVGGTNPFPASLCLAPILGTDVDIVLREWEYWSYGDGLEHGRLAKPGASADQAGVELFLRTALALPNQPAVHFLKMNHAGGADGGGLGAVLNQWIRAPKTSSTSSTPKGAGALGKLLKKLTPSAGLLADYASFSVQGFDAFGAPFDHLREAAPAERWAKEKVDVEHCHSRDVGACPIAQGPGAKQDGHHERAQWVPEHMPRSWWDDRRLKLLFINWHPG